MSLLQPLNDEKKDTHIGIRVPEELKEQFAAHCKTIGSGITLNAALIQLMRRELEAAGKPYVDGAPVVKAVRKKTTAKKKGARK